MDAPGGCFFGEQVTKGLKVVKVEQGLLLHLSMASLGLDSAGKQPVSLMVRVEQEGKKQEHVLCTLKDCASIPLDLNFSLPFEVFTKGADVPVHISGYWEMAQDDDDFLLGDDEEEEEEEEEQAAQPPAKKSPVAAAKKSPVAAAKKSPQAPPAKKSPVAAAAKPAEEEEEDEEDEEGEEEESITSSMLAELAALEEEEEEEEEDEEEEEEMPPIGSKRSATQAGAPQGKRARIDPQPKTIPVPKKGGKPPQQQQQKGKPQGGFGGGFGGQKKGKNRK